MLELDEIENGLKKKFSDVEMPELLLRASSLNQAMLNRLHAFLGRPLPQEFERLILKYEFGNLDLRVFFGAGGNYVDWLIKHNSKGSWPVWWGQGERPSELLFVAATDAFVILLDLKNGQVYSFLRDGHWQEKLLIAEDFELFVRGAGTLLLKEDDANRTLLAEQVKAAVGAESSSFFWDKY